MTEQSKYFQPGHAGDAYALANLTRALPPLVALQAFVAAARLGSISRAADHLCRTQGAVSRQIQQLETRNARGQPKIRALADVLLQLARDDRS
ncbi:regulatory helix-turn-helix protein, lysR family [Trinickia caryophylli]|uniref:Regulatory helix-turn-helix protein, lysR family n=1 Tax=Trinickia caryophylli TaxID=28094 RepID=A0A1X7GJY5_TRICW|nr:regulatory helix-turn-helix protein, lysR family [Trinickia caryophylli]